MTKSQVRRSIQWWMERESEEEDFRPKVEDVLRSTPLSDEVTYSLKEVD